MAIKFLLIDHKVIPPVFSPGFFRISGIYGSFLAIADGRQARRINSQVNQKGFGTFSTPITQRKVVLIRTTLVTMALDGHRRIGIPTQPFGFSQQVILGGGSQG